MQYWRVNSIAHNSKVDVKAAIASFKKHSQGLTGGHLNNVNNIVKELQAHPSLTAQQMGDILFKHGTLLYRHDQALMHQLFNNVGIGGLGTFGQMVFANIFVSTDFQILLKFSFTRQRKHKPISEGGVP